MIEGPYECAARGNALPRRTNRSMILTTTISIKDIAK
jgi:hypothetical protein